MSGKIKRPPFWKVIMEGRAFFELGAYYTTYPILKRTPQGDGHPVLVLPGLLGSDTSTAPLRKFLKAKGYHPYGWELGRNFAQLTYIDRLVTKIEQLHAIHGKKVSLIGWSMGGLFARLLANKMPEKIRQVITLGSPFKGIHGDSNADFVFELVSGRKRGEVDQNIRKLVEAVPPIPFTAIYSKGDGIVSWEHCLESEQRDDIQNVEVWGSHFGLGVNPMSLLCIADRLSQKPENWQPFDFPAGLKGLFYPQFWKSSPEVA